jgi:hypothetical protein
MPAQNVADQVHSLLEESGQEVERGVRFDWLTNRAPVEDGANVPPRITYRLTALHTRLGGDWARLGAKHKQRLEFDFLVNQYTLVVVDERKHFTSARLTSLDFYDGLEHILDVERYRQLCLEFRESADSHERSRRASDFPFPGGNAAQRAYFDTAKDLLTPVHGYRLVRLPAPTGELTKSIEQTLDVLL